MSERNILRRVKIGMGMMPSHYLLYLLYVRIDMCSRLLIKLFRTHLLTTPTECHTNMRRAVA